MRADPIGAADGVTVVVDDGADALAAEVTDELRHRHRPVIHVDAPRLGLLDVQLADGNVEVEGCPVRAVLFRATAWSRHDGGFVDEDATFASSEVTATWLAATRLPGVIAINRLHPEASMTFSEWPVWHRALAAARVPQAQLAIGDVGLSHATWLPWGGGVARRPKAEVRRSFAPALLEGDLGGVGLWLDGMLLAGTGSDAAQAAAGCLVAEGLRLVGITLDRRGQVAFAAARPIVPEGSVSAVARHVAESLAA